MPVTAGDSLWISLAGLLAHYAVYIPAVAGDPLCTTGALWGSVGPAGRALSLASAAAAFAMHLASLWRMRRRREPGVWASTLAFYLAQTAFLPALRAGRCHGRAPFAAAAIASLAAAAAAAAWYARTVWSPPPGSPPAPAFDRLAAAYLLLHAAGVDMLYYGSKALGAPARGRE